VTGAHDGTPLGVPDAIGDGVRQEGAELLDGAAVAEAIREEVRAEITALTSAGHVRPDVVVVLVGDDAPSRVYARRILRNAERVGIAGRIVELPAAASADDVRNELRGLSDDPGVGGVILQMPLPRHIRPREVIESLDPLKDIDGIHPLNAGLAALGHEAMVPSCAEAAMEILKRAGVRLAGRHAVVVGRSSVVGRPAALLLLREHATVTICHRQTADLGAELSRADVVVVAAGAPGLIRGDMIRPGAVVIDCGINVVDGVVVGDVDLPSVLPVAGAVSPVPGGVGPVTNAVLLDHLVRATRARLEGGFADAPAAAAQPA
jgi:methylenetetrahydrofolate dehydrogenase (NADP+) / methenyltetrahydrofolate cyclohydrolase